ncbi:MAG: HlyD family secretion protein [Ectothiorhodospiraceae bacterium]|jgi:membrane fusion protein (multidrug efflux system)
MRIPISLRQLRPGRRAVRAVLLLVVPLIVLLIAGGFYLTRGRYVGTENAYVHTDKVAVSARVSGPVVSVPVSENEHVRRGQPLFRVDPKPYRLSLQQAESALQSVRTDLETLKASYREKRQELKAAGTDAAFAEREYRRHQRLAKQKVVSDSELDSYRHKRDAADEKVQVIKQSLARIRASLGGDPDVDVEAHPRFREALAERDAAALDLAHTQVYAAFAGFAAKVPEVGDFVSPGKPAMSIVAGSGAWVDANLKETDLTHVHAGQPVSIEVDTYPGAEWHGRVDSIAQATGAEFSVLPAQNATGNWVKVVQRVPVRIAIEDGPRDLMLRSGLSAVVAIDTGWHQRGPAFLQPLAQWIRDLIEPAHARQRP